MGLQVEKILKRIEHSLGGPLSSNIDHIDLINDVGEFACTIHPWRWLERQMAYLDVREGVPYATLPLNFPGDHRDIITVDTADSLVNSLRLVSPEYLLKVRTSQIITSSFNYLAAIGHIPYPRRNVIPYSVTWDEPPWEPLATTTATPNSGANPLNGTNDAFLVNQPLINGGTGLELPAYDFEDGTWCASIYAKQGSSPDCGISIHTADPALDGGFDTGVKYVWATETLTVERAVGAGVHDAKVTKIRGGWVRIEARGERTTYGGASDGSTLHYLLLAADQASTGSTYFWGPQMEHMEKVPGATVARRTATPYQPTYGALLPYHGPPVPVLQLEPVPTADEDGKLVIIYRAGWPRINEDYDWLAIPPYFEGWFMEACKEWARGLEEEDNASLSERVTSLLVGPRDRHSGLPANELLRSCMLRDIEVQPDDGPVRGGAASSGRTWIDWGDQATVEGPQ